VARTRSTKTGAGFLGSNQETVRTSPSLITRIPTQGRARNARSALNRLSRAWALPKQNLGSQDASQSSLAVALPANPRRTPGTLPTRKSVDQSLEKPKRTNWTSPRYWILLIEPRWLACGWFCQVGFSSCSWLLYEEDA
jgi:hypothetical protein